MAEETTKHEAQVPNLGNAFFVPVVLDPTTGMPMVLLYPTKMLPHGEEIPQQSGLFMVPTTSHGGEPVPLSYNPPLGNRPEGAEGNAAEDEAARVRNEQRVVRRFRVGIHLDLLLIMKLVTMVFIFSQDGSKDKLVLLFLAGLVYLYQTGALTPLLRWASERARRAMMPPMQAANLPPPQDVAEAAAQPAAAPADPNAAPQEVERAQDGNGEEQQLNPAEQPAEPPVQLQPQQPGFLREVQMFVIGLITSLLPGFHNVD